MTGPDDAGLLPLARMAEELPGWRERFRAAEPFPHIVLDDFLPGGVHDRAVAEFPGSDAYPWQRWDTAHEDKRTSRGGEGLSPFLQTLLLHLNGGPFVDFLEALTGIAGLIPDPHLEGGGATEVRRGGRLGVHADFNRSQRLGLDRRLNVLVYLNPGWDEAWGGHLELWDPEVKACGARIAPLGNRVVIFEVTDRAYHGHPDPLDCPEGVVRRSLSTYYYTAGRPEDERAPAHPPLFRARPGERFRRAPRHLLTRLAPPILVDLARALLGRGR